MDLQIQSKNLELNEDIRSYINSKVVRLGRHLPEITQAKVELAMENTKAQDDRDSCPGYPGY